MPAGRVFVSGHLASMFVCFSCEESVNELFSRNKILEKYWTHNESEKLTCGNPENDDFSSLLHPFYSLTPRKEDDTDDEAKKRKLRQRGGYFEIFFSRILGLIIVTGWWFQIIFFMFTPIWGRFPF